MQGYSGLVTAQYLGEEMTVLNLEEMQIAEDQLPRDWQGNTREYKVCLSDL